jgi:hypothetical protein
LLLKKRGGGTDVEEEVGVRDVVSYEVGSGIGRCVGVVVVMLIIFNT